MPLLKYFMTVGAALTVFLLVLNAVMEPARPQLPPPAAKRVISVPEPRVTTGSTVQTRSLPTVPAVGEEARSPDAMAAAPVSATPSPQVDPVSTQLPAAAPTRRKKRTTAGRTKADVPGPAWRTYEPSPYSSYARERAMPDYGAEGTLGPH